MSPKSPTAPACSESELICLVGFCHPNRHGGGRHTAPTFPPLKTLLSQPPWLLSLLTKGPVQRPGTCRCLCWDAQLLLSPNATCLDIKDSPPSSGWEVGRVLKPATCPNLDSASISPFPQGGRREEKERDAFEKRLPCHSLSGSPCS